MQRLGAVNAVLGRKRRADRDVPEDGVGLGEIAVVADLEQRHLARRVLGQKVRRATLAAQNVHFDCFVRHVQQGQRKADLVAVAGALHRIELVHSGSSFRKREGAVLVAQYRGQTMMPLRIRRKTRAIEKLENPTALQCRGRSFSRDATNQITLASARGRIAAARSCRTIERS
ncbi:hypothetical protein ACVW0J_002533 [Bradyrhizobium sp. i1.7.7]